MKVLVIGGVAAGTKTAAKLKREDRSAEVTLISKGEEISYAGCGLPYYVGGVIEGREELVVNTPAMFSELTGVKVYTGREAVELDAQKKEVRAKNLQSGAMEVYGYDKLVIATGASAVFPPITGLDRNGVFKMRTPDDAVQMRSYIAENSVKKAVVIGAGFIGLEVAENLKAQGVNVTVVEFMPQVMPNILDPEMAVYVKKHLMKQGIRVLTGAAAQEVLGDGAVEGVKTTAGTLPCTMLVAAAGIRPNTAFLNESGIDMFKGTIKVDAQMKTSLPDVYAAGDCCMVTSRMTGESRWAPMGSSANLEGRTLAQILAGRDKIFPGVLGTAVCKLPGLNVARTGLTESQAVEAGYDVATAVAVTDDKAHYYADASFFITKLIADKATGRLLGAQVFGPGNVDKMIDIVVMAISMNGKLSDLENVDFAYAPPFSTAIHPLVQAAYVLMNKMDGTMVSMTPAEYAAGKAEGWKVIDVAKAPSIPGAAFVKLEGLTGDSIPGFEKDENILLVCTKGKRGYMLQNIMKSMGYTNTVVLEGATFFNDVKVKMAAGKLDAAEIRRVKGLGFLQDKLRDGYFNCRVITRNGKITNDEMRAITEAAQLYGNGEVAMTTRLTMEIQGVPHENVDAIMEFLMQAGLATGGTGSKVRPVVSCKGTTCQYGLIDTFALSEEIHERFYVGWHDVSLPHKFKIAVGGCPNNCVKPDLNDLGIIGQKVPHIDPEKCRGCKKCQVQNSCPIKVAKVEEGKLVIDPSACNHCGRCVGKCPFHALEDYTAGYRVYIGGRWGKKVAQGHYLDKVFTDKDEVLNVVEKAILLFRDQGISGERFADTVARLGFENVQAQLLSDDLLKNKEANLAKVVKGGATC